MKTSPAAPLINELSLQRRQASSYSLWRRAQSLTLTSPAAPLIDELSLQTGKRAPTIYQDESFTVLHIDGLLPTKLISLTSPSLYFKQMGSLIQFSLDELSLQSRQTSSYSLWRQAQSLTLTSPAAPLIDELSLQTSRRAPTIYQDEPFTVLHTDGLLPTKLISLTSPSLYFKQMGSLIQFSLDELSLQRRQTSSYSLWRQAQSLTLTSPAAPLIDELSLQTGRRAPTIYQDEPFTVLHTDGLLPTKLISLTIPSLYFKQMGSLIQFSFDELSLQRRQTSSYSLWRQAHSLTLTSPAAPLIDELSLQTGRRAPTIYQDEPFTVLHTDGLLPTKLISLTSPSLYFKQMGSLIQFSFDELSLQHRQASSYSLWRRAQSLTLTGPAAPLIDELSLQTGRRAPTIYQDEPFTVLHTDGLLPTKLISLTSPSLYFKQMGSLIQFSFDELSLQRRQASSHSL